MGDSQTSLAQRRLIALALLAVVAPVIAHPLAWWLPGTTAYRSTLSVPVGGLVAGGTLLLVAITLARASSSSQVVPVIGSKGGNQPTQRGAPASTNGTPRSIPAAVEASERSKVSDPTDGRATPSRQGWLDELWRTALRCDRLAAQAPRGSQETDAAEHVPSKRWESANTCGWNGWFSHAAINIALLTGWLATLVTGVLFSRHPSWSAAVLPGWVATVVLWWLGNQLTRAELYRVAAIWSVTGVVVAANGLMRLPMEADFVSTIGNRNVLGAYLAATWFVSLGWVTEQRTPCWPFRSWRQRGRDRARQSNPNEGCVQRVREGDPSEFTEHAGTAVGRQLAGCSRKWTLWGLGTLLLVLGIIFCGSRGAWLGLIAGGLTWLGLGGRRGRIAALIGVAVVAALTLGNQSRLISWWQTDVRPVIWRSTLSMIAAQPWTGHGLGTFVATYPTYRDPAYFQRPKATNVTDHAHNEWLQVVAEQGIPAVIVMSLLWLWSVAQGICNARTNHLSRGLVAAAVVFLVHGAIDIGLRTATIQPVFWLLLGMLGGNGENQANRTIECRGRLRGLVTAALGALALAVLWWGFWQPLRADWLDHQARVAGARRQLITAVEQAGKVLEIQPWRLETRYWLAGLLADSDTIPGRRAAIEQCEELRRWAPDYADVTFNLAHLYTLEGRFDQAAAMWAIVQQTRPDLFQSTR